MALQESRGIILSVRKFKEKDFLVKIFLKDFGKMMFFVRGSKKKNNPLSSNLKPYVEASFIVDIRDSGLSFIRDTKEVILHRNIQTDIFKSAYATYISSLIDVSLEDRQVAQALYRQFSKGLDIIDQGVDPEIITNIFEVKLLYYFGVMPILDSCVICGNSGPFDYSDKYHGVICTNHFHMDENRYHTSPNVVYLIQKFAYTNVNNLKSVDVNDDIKEELRRVIDMIYDELVGIRLKSKKFIMEMKNWSKLIE